MLTNEKVTQAILGAIDEINGQLPKGEKLEKSVSAALFGDGGKLDSLGLVSLITTVEQRIEEDFNMTLTLLEEVADLEKENPFRTVQGLADYITSILEKKANG